MVGELHERQRFGRYLCSEGYTMHRYDEGDVRRVATRHRMASNSHGNASEPPV